MRPTCFSRDAAGRFQHVRHLSEFVEPFGRPLFFFTTAASGGGSSSMG
jgi:hypothetical protein